MKKLIFVLLIPIFLIGCGVNAKELDSFAEDYNQSARKYDATELVPDEFGEIEEEDGEKWRELFNSKEHTIEALYDGNNVKGYYINVKSDTNSIDKTGKGYNAVLTLADTLGLDIDKLEDGMQTAFNESFHDYEDGEHSIRISVINVTSASMSITVEKK
ncbi:hypothetical protein [Oceanobacillus alkalisoli]|uniref:hypothetical protein n=1 Tax=Oceanobacillus alkalisoli TaxID=2925113 RepID=UPI001EF02644|nr:hypothetical protein [Oceanobacillus alkalisoli]MCF3942164.1 hypothetical protein [Oceanobacillus alkalisoli]MCG5104396.1 hypothetical protein [Oceanobacillus alkalisoli]